MQVVRVNGWALCALGLAALAAIPAQAATVGYVGAQLNLADGWRTPGVAKTQDIDADNVYGSLGWKMFHIHSDNTTPPINYATTTGQNAGQTIQSLPSYISITEQTNPPGFASDPEAGADIGFSANYSKIDDPNGGPDIWSGIRYKGFAVPNQITHLFNMTFSAGVSPTATYRLGVFVDNTGPIDGSPVALQVKGFAGGASGDSGLIAKAQATQVNNYYFFDITGANPGEVYGIYTRRQAAGGNGAVTVGGFTVDAVPEPGAITAALGALSVLALRRRK